MFNSKVFFSIIVALSIGLGFGYFLAPDKIRIEERVVERVVTKKEEYKKNTKKYDDNGKLREETEEVGSKETNSNTTKNEKITEKEKTQKHYAVKAGAVINPRDMSGKVIARVGTELRLPIFNSWVGAEADLNLDRPLTSIYLRLEF